MDNYELELQQRLRRALQEICEAYVEWDGWPNGLWQVVSLIKEAMGEIVEDMQTRRRR